MRKCKKCEIDFSTWITVEGKRRNCQRRQYCFGCSPFGSGNTRDLTKPDLSQDEKKAKKRRIVRKSQKKLRKARKQKLVDLLGGKCKYCGYDKCVASLQFHHVGKKDFSISYWLLAKWEKILKEVKKCELVCANCHGEIHWGCRITVVHLFEAQRVGVQLSSVPLVRLRGIMKCLEKLRNRK